METMTVKELAQYLGISLSHAYRVVHSGCPAYKIKGKIIIPKGEIEEWIQQQRMNVYSQRWRTKFHRRERMCPRN